MTWEIVLGIIALGGFIGIIRLLVISSLRKNLRYIWSDYINKNISAFQDVYLIPYDETPADIAT